MEAHLLMMRLSGIGLRSEKETAGDKIKAKTVLGLDKTRSFKGIWQNQSTRITYSGKKNQVTVMMVLCRKSLRENFNGSVLWLSILSPVRNGITFKKTSIKKWATRE